MVLITCVSEQQKIRQEITDFVENKNSKFHSKFVNPAAQSTSTYEVAKSVQEMRATTTTQIASVKKMIPKGGDSGQPAAKKPRVDNSNSNGTSSGSGNQTTPKLPAWARLARDNTLRYCPGWDETTKKQCGWNSRHWWGEDCPVFQNNSKYEPKFWGPLNSGWDEKKARGEGVTMKELKELYQADINRFIEKIKKKGKNN